MKINLEKFICDIINELCFYPECSNVSAAINDALKDQGFICNNGHILKLESNQEWSEEDEYTLDETIKHLEELIRIDRAKHCACDVQYYQRDIDWLKSLKDRYTWRPSEEQMKALTAISSKEILSGYERGMIVGLYTELQKLREE